MELISILEKFGYPASYIKERLEYSSANRPEKIWVLNNMFKIPFVLFVELNNQDENDFFDFVRFAFPTISMVVIIDNSEIKKIKVKNYLDNTFSFTNEIETPKKIEINNSLIYGVVEKGYKKLNTIDSSVENLFFEAHSIVRDIDGLHPDQALDEICKFIYAKLYDEENVYSSNNFLFQRGLYYTIEELASVVRAVYKNSTEYDERVYSMRIPKYKKSRGVFDSEIKLSTPAISKLVGLFETIDLTNSKIDVKGRAFQKMLLPAMRAGMGQYFTPLPIIEFIVNVLTPNIDDLIIDPFSGSGHFLSQALNFVINRNDLISEKKVHEFKFHKLHGIEKSERMVRISMTDMRLHGDGHSNIRCTDALLSFENYEDLKEESFDIVMSNPPFGSILSSEAIERLDNFELMKGKKSVPLEIIGLERCLQLLRPGGRFGIVLPESIITNKNTKFVRDWLIKKVNITGVVGLPLETFSPFGANIKTIVIFGIKNKFGQSEIKNADVIIGNIESVGYDFKGQVVDKNDTNSLVEPIKNIFEKYEQL